MASNVLYALIGFLAALMSLDWLSEFRTEITVGCTAILGLAMFAMWLSARKRRLQHLFDVMSDYADKHPA